MSEIAFYQTKRKWIERREDRRRRRRRKNVKIRSGHFNWTTTGIKQEYIFLNFNLLYSVKDTILAVKQFGENVHPENLLGIFTL